MHTQQKEILLTVPLIASRAIVLNHSKIKELKASIGTLTIEEERLKERIKNIMGNFETIYHPGNYPLFTYKYEDQFKFDFDRFKIEQPDLFREYDLTYPLRKLRVK